MKDNPAPVLDETDFKILNAILEGKRKGLKEISKFVKIPLKTVHDRITKMKKAGIVESVTSFEVNLEPLGYDQLAIVEIGVKNDSDRPKIVKFCLKSNIVTSVYETAGTFDIVVMLRYKGSQKLYKFLDELYSRFPNIQNSETLLSYVAHREQKNPFPISPSD